MTVSPATQQLRSNYRPPEVEPGQGALYEDVFDPESCRRLGQFLLPLFDVYNDEFIMSDLDSGSPVDIEFIKNGKTKISPPDELNDIVDSLDGLFPNQYRGPINLLRARYQRPSRLGIAPYHGDSVGDYRFVLGLLGNGSLEVGREHDNEEPTILTTPGSLLVFNNDTIYEKRLGHAVRSMTHDRVVLVYSRLPRS